MQQPVQWMAKPAGAVGSAPGTEYLTDLEQINIQEIVNLEQCRYTYITLDQCCYTYFIREQCRYSYFIDQYMYTFPIPLVSVKHTALGLR